MEFEKNGVVNFQSSKTPLQSQRPGTSPSVGTGYDFGFDDGHADSMVAEKYHSLDSKDEEEYELNDMLHGYDTLGEQGRGGSGGGGSSSSSSAQAALRMGDIMSGQFNRSHPEQMYAFFAKFGSNMARRLLTIDPDSDPSYRNLLNFLNNTERNRRIKHTRVPVKPGCSSPDSIFCYDVQVDMPSSIASGPGRMKKEQVNARMVGITTLLERIFWRDRAGDFSDIPLRKEAAGRIKEISNYRQYCHKAGAAHGSYVHNQVYQIIKHIDDYSGRDEDLDEVMMRYLDQNPTENIDPCTLRIMRKMDSINMIPMYSEFSVWDEVGWATKIDLGGWIIQPEMEQASLEAEQAGQAFNPADWVAQGLYRRGESVMIEIKTGYEDGHFNAVLPDADNRPGSGDRLMDNLDELPFHVPDIPFERAAMQLLLTLLITQQRYNHLPNKAYVWHIEPKQGQLSQYRLPIWMHKSEYRGVFYRKCMGSMPAVQFKRINDLGMSVAHVQKKKT